ncbi:MAG: hypothetical protein LUG83_10925 [Lachnospiraceae bacterium]|nr:hypothetical protein [Lachnospiraceae bacterium]
MILQKHFKFDTDKGLVCENFADVEHYIEAKIIILQNYENYSNKDVRLGLLQEILNMYAEDIVAPDIDMSAMSNCVYSDKMNFNQMLMYFDFIMILGSIEYNVFDYDKNKIKYVEDGVNGPISTANMFASGYDELYNAKKERKKAAYGATLIFVTTLESELRRKFKSRFIKRKTIEIEQRITDGAFSPTREQRDLLACLEQKETAKVYNRVYATSEAAYELFSLAGVIDIPGEQKNLLQNKTTLNQLLGYTIFSSEVEASFLETMKVLFKTGNLNLRNDMAHGGFGYKNYYHLTVTSMLYFLCGIVIDDHCWKN